MSYCDDCIHKPVCYRTDSVSPSYADKCGNFESDNSIEPFKPMVEIDLYSVIKQSYIEREVLDKIRAEIEARLCDVVSGYTDGYRTAIQGVLVILDKYKAESEET